MFYCGNQWGYTPLGRLVNIPTDSCSNPTDLKAVAINQYVTFSWVAPHDYLYFILQFREAGSADPYTDLTVYGQNRLVELAVNTEYEWQVKLVCSADPLRESAFVSGPAVTTGSFMAECTAVTDVIITNMGTSLRASWNSTGAVYYKVTLRAVNSQFTRIYITQNTYYDFDNLTAGGQYIIEVIAFCNDGTSHSQPNPNPIIEAPFLQCPAIGAINYTRMATSILVGWISAGSGYKYDIYLNGELVIHNYPQLNYAFLNLVPFTDYEITVITNCGNGVSGPVSITVKTLALSCANPVLLDVTDVTATSFKINWTPASGIASQQLIINNGAVINLTSSDNEYTISAPGGSTTNYLIRSVCVNNASSGVTGSYTLQGCGAVTGLAVTPTHDGLTAVWNPIANAAYYLVEVRKTSTNTLIEILTVYVNTYSVENLEEETEYSVKVTSFCGGIGGSDPIEGGFQTVITETTVLPACENAVLSDISITPTSLSFSFAFASGKTDGYFIARLINQTTSEEHEQELTQTGLVSFTELDPSTVYNIYVYSKDPEEECLPVIITTETTLTQCRPPTDVTAVLQTNDTEILVSATASLDTPATYQLEYRLFGSLVWISKGAITLPYTITTVLPGKYIVRLRSNCATSESDWVESNYTCPTPIIGDISVSNSLVTINWSELLGIDEYIIEVNGLDGTFKSYTSSNAFVGINNLAPNSSFNVVVKAVCGDDLFAESDPKPFTTGAGTVPGICAEVNFTAFLQACGTTNPEDPTPDPSGCLLEAMDWELSSSYFIPITSDPPNDTFIEATFTIPHAGPAGTVSLMPGGICGFIVNPDCRPQSSTNLELQILQGGVLETGSGTMATNGNITVAGSYEIEGSPELIIRVRGNYQKVI